MRINYEVATLIGAGGHADDIYAAYDEPLDRIDHHTDFDVDQHCPVVVLGMSDPQVRAAVWREMAETIPGFFERKWVHPTAYIGTGCSLGTGTHVNYSSAMTRTFIGHHCTVAPGVTICGDVTIGDRVFIGAGAVIRNRVSIGDDAFIRMGAVVKGDVAPGERY